MLKKIKTITQVPRYIFVLSLMIVYTSTANSMDILSELLTDQDKLSEPILLLECSMNNTGNTCVKEFEIKYRGNYDISIFYNRPKNQNGIIEKDQSNTLQQAGIDAHVWVFHGDTKIFQEEYKLSVKKGDVGRTLSVLSSPDKLPIDKKLRLKLELELMNGDQLHRFNSITLRIKRLSSVMR